MAEIPWPKDLNVLADQLELIERFAHPEVTREGAINELLAEERVILSRRERHVLKRPVTRKAK